jgi:F-type H+-transporting ATPase subunit gamma
MTFVEAADLATLSREQYLEGQFDEFYLVYNQFKSALVQEIQIEKLLPLSLDVEAQEKTGSMDYLFESNKSDVLDHLVPKYVATQIFRSHLESVASELGARMTAMENATKNAKEMIGDLTLVYNRVRQAAITTELMDIVNGSESIK